MVTYRAPVGADKSFNNKYLSDLSLLPVDLLTVADRIKQLLEHKPKQSCACELPNKRSCCDCSLCDRKFSPSHRLLTHLTCSQVTQLSSTSLPLPAGKALAQPTTAWQQQKVGAAHIWGDLRGTGHSWEKSRFTAKTGEKPWLKSPPTLPGLPFLLHSHHPS